MLRDAPGCSGMFSIGAILVDLFHNCHFWEVFVAVGMLRDAPGCFGMLWDALKSSRMLWDALGRSGMFSIDAILGNLFHNCHFWEEFVTVGML